MKSTAAEQHEKWIEAQLLLESMVAALRFYGMDENHRLIRQASELRDWIIRQDRPQ